MIKNAIWLFILTLVVLIIFLPSYSRMQDLRQQNLKQNDTIEQLVKENTYLKEERRRLEEDPAYLEKVAREKMGLVREGEVIYKIETVNREE